MSLPTNTPIRQCPGCKCDLNHRNLYICHECWRGLPKSLTAAYNQSRSLEDRRTAYREILKHFREQHEQPQLGL